MSNCDSARSGDLNGAFSMELNLSEEAAWASGLAARLRLVQANMADDPPSMRCGYLGDEIERALKEIIPSRRAAHLDELLSRFPSWEGVRSSSRSDVQVGSMPLTADQLVDQLVRLAPSLSMEARAEFAARLHSAGLSIKEASPELIELPAELQKGLGLSPGKPLHIDRAVRLLAIAMELVKGLDQLAWTIWKQLAPKSVIKKEGDLVRLASSYLSGDPEVSAPQLTQPVEKTRRLVAGLLGAVGRAGSVYSKNYIAALSPEVIEDWAKMEKKWGESLEAACWRKFRQQSQAHASEAVIEHEIQEAIARSAENLILGRSGS